MARTDNKVYLVVSGHYSEYEVHWVTLDKTKAAEYVEAKNRHLGEDEYQVQEFVLDEHDELNLQILIYMGKEGDVVWSNKNEDYDGVQFHGFDIWKIYSEEPDIPVLIWTVPTTDMVKAIKIVNEKRSAILAANLWGNEAGVREAIKGAKKST